MKQLDYFSDFLLLKEKYKNKKLNYPQVGDNVWIKFIYFQGIKTLRFYSKIFFGRCIAYKKKNSIVSQIQLRNVFNKDPVELSFFLNSPFVLKIISKRKNRYSKFNKNKLYYLRYKKLGYSKVKR
jgi:ribosomal protein L19